MKKIIICAANITQLDSFYDSNFLNNIKNTYDLSFLIGNLDKNDNKRINRIQNFGQILEVADTFSKKNKINFRQKLNLFCYFGNEILKNIGRFKNDFLIERTLAVNAPHLLNFFKFLYNFKLLNLLFSIAIFFLKIKPINVFGKKNIKEFDLILIAYKIYDPYSFTDELIRFSRRNNVKTYGIQINWDALVFRIPLEKPDFLAVWGEQSFSFSVGLHEISPYRVFPTGPLAFDIYKNNQIKKKTARQKLGLPINGKIIAVCLSDIVYDDIFLVKKINKLLINKAFSDDTFFYFKGYRYGKDLTLKKSFMREYGRQYKNIKTHKNIYFWEPKLLNLEKRDYFRNFFKAVDGIISTFSTMSVEASLHNLPSIALHYDPSKYKVNTYGFPFKLYSYHLYSLKNQDGLIYCNSRNELKNSIEKLLNFNKTILKKGHLTKIPLSSVYYAEETASEKLKKSIDVILTKGKRDNSYIGYK